MNVLIDFIVKLWEQRQLHRQMTRLHAAD